MTKFAIVDLEATDAHLTQNKVIQVGIVILEDGKITKKYSKNINPHEKLAPKIIELTGLTDEILEKAVDFSSVAKEISDLLEGSIFVAHNVKFDYSLLKKSLNEQGFEFSLPRVDTVELSRVFYPSLEKYSLEYLGEELNLVHENPHEALSDAEATANLLLKIQGKIKGLPRVVVGEILRHADNLLYDTKFVIEEIFENMDENAEDFIVRNNIATKVVSFESEEVNVNSYFSANMNSLGLDVRNKQKILVDIFNKRSRTRGTSFIQAQTGIGKTYAYLLSQLALGKKLVVSTATKALQEQIIDDHAREFRKIFGVNISKFLGFKNYIKLERFSAILAATNFGKNYEIFKMKVLVWLTETDTGELDELSPIMTSPEYLEAICHDGNYNPISLNYEQDFLRLAYKKLQYSSVVVVNHALMIEKLKNEASFFDERVLIVDEAQQLFSILESSQESRFDLKAIEDRLNQNNFNSSTLTKRLWESLNYHLQFLPASIEKVRLDTRELGENQLLEFLPQNDSFFVWKSGDYLLKSPKDFLDFSAMLPSRLKTYMVGATLSLSDKSNKLPELLGFDSYTFDEIPSEVSDNQVVYVTEDGPNVGNLNVDNFSAVICEKIMTLADLEKPILVLLTSRDLLEETSLKLNDTDISYVAQDIHGTASQIKKRFDDGRVQVLLGLASFWEGMDFDKQDDMVLLIPRLPFSTPEDVLLKKYSERFKNPFYDFNVPMTTLRLRQAIGRVNRRSNQKSAVIILDRRIATKNYGKKMIRNIEQIAPVKICEFDEIVSKTADFLV